jgi:hypothetical protein
MLSHLVIKNRFQTLLYLQEVVLNNKVGACHEFLPASRLPTLPAHQYLKGRVLFLQHTNSANPFIIKTSHHVDGYAYRDELLHEPTARYGRLSLKVECLCNSGLASCCLRRSALRV